MTKRIIPEEIIHDAQVAYGATNLPASISILQWIVEGNCGKDEPKGSNNPFGYKATGNQPFIYAESREQDKTTGSYYWKNSRFRKFNTVADAFIQHAKLLTKGKAYAGIRQYLSDPLLYIQKMAPIYATDMHYATILTDVYKENDLGQYDKKIYTVKPIHAAAIAATGGAIVTAVSASKPNLVPVSHKVSMLFPDSSLWFILGVCLGILLVVLFILLWNKFHKSPENSFGDKRPPLTIEELTQMAIRSGLQPLIDGIAALKAQAVAGAETASQVTDLTNELATANAKIAEMTQDDTDTDAAVAAAAGLNVDGTPVAAS